MRHGETIAFVHGSLTPASFLPLLKEKSLSIYQLLAIRRDGYSGERRIHYHDIYEEARYCIRILEELGIPKVHLVGHSYGGAIALAMARDFAGVTTSLFLVEPASVPDSKVGLLFRRKMLWATEAYEAGLYERGIGRFLTAVNGSQANFSGCRGLVEDSHVLFEREIPIFAELAIHGVRRSAHFVLCFRSGE